MYFHSVNSYPLTGYPNYKSTYLGTPGTVDFTCIDSGSAPFCGEMTPIAHVSGLSTQTSITGTTSAITSPQTGFIAKFVSDPLKGVSSISANTWTFNCASDMSSTNANFWINGLYIYVFRPDVNGGSIVGAIFENYSTAGGSNPASTAEKVNHYTISGNAVSGVSDDDVIIVELWSNTTQGMATSYTVHAYFDGGVVTTTNGTTVSDHASFLETPQALTFNNQCYPRVIAKGSTTTNTSSYASSSFTPSANTLVLFIGAVTIGTSSFSTSFSGTNYTWSGFSGASNLNGIGTQTSVVVLGVLSGVSPSSETMNVTMLGPGASGTGFTYIVLEISNYKTSLPISYLSLNGGNCTGVLTTAPIATQTLTTLGSVNNVSVKSGSLPWCDRNMLLTACFRYGDSTAMTSNRASNGFSFLAGQANSSPTCSLDVFVKRHTRYPSFTDHTGPIISTNQITFPVIASDGGTGIVEIPADNSQTIDLTFIYSSGENDVVVSDSTASQSYKERIAGVVTNRLRDS